MLISLEIENFKGIAERQRIDFAPLTLLFGANSAGKSTILQALLYLHELLERGSADVDRTELGGSVLELGGFARLIHRHQTDRVIVLRVEFTSPAALERFGRELSSFPFPDLDDDVERAWLETVVRFRTSATFRGPLLERAAIGVGESREPLVWLETGASVREGEVFYARVNLSHPILAKAPQQFPELWSAMRSPSGPPHDAPLDALDTLKSYADLIDAWKEIAIPEDVVKRGLDPSSDERFLDADTTWNLGELTDKQALPVFALARSRHCALPRLDEPLRIIPFGDLDGDREQLEHLMRLPFSEENQRILSALQSSVGTRETATSQVRTFLEMVVLGTIAQLSSLLNDALYIGPLRAIPPRGSLYQRPGQQTSWGDGMAAWDILLSDRGYLVEHTNEWLDALGVGCRVIIQQLFDRTGSGEDLSADHVDKTVRRLLLDTRLGSLVLPSEVGAGISQIIPVVVAALERRGGLCMIEQPEIHVHPAVQVGLGDLFIEATSVDAGRRMLLVESHSEHLILRLLRRIREAAEGELPSAGAVFSADKLSVLHVESTAEGVRIRRLRVDENGEFLDPWPQGFFDERFPEIYGA